MYQQPFCRHHWLESHAQQRQSAGSDDTEGKAGTDVYQRRTCFSFYCFFFTFGGCRSLSGLGSIQMSFVFQRGFALCDPINHVPKS